MWKDIIVWAIGFMALMVSGIIGFLVKKAVAVITGLLKSILEELKKLTGISIEHEQRIKGLEEAKHDHETRIRTLEGN